ncbi:hypothetical protein [Streptomyces sp. Amel2xC10]|nr:hypothetical protein [Streptomyces sp. Amel2xC10]SMF01049.1 hypothetical protein SAMN02745830_01034 [Streptomyces sp. Amel2xC10]
MTAVMVAIAPTRTVGDAEPDAVVLVEDIDALTAETLPGCGDDNPYN